MVTVHSRSWGIVKHHHSHDRCRLPFLAAVLAVVAMAFYHILQKDQVNCDPTHELEEIILEPNPLHKKSQRLTSKNATLAQVSVWGRGGE